VQSTTQSNATSESLNRLAKLEARQAYGFRNPAEPAPPGSHRLYPRLPSPVTHRNRDLDTKGNWTEARSRLTSKARLCRNGNCCAAFPAGAGLMWSARIGRWSPGTAAAAWVVPFTAR
jgi:hypothetical protein